MSASELMDKLAEIIRDERLVEELQRMAAGRLSPGEVEELERRAEGDPALREAIALCTPVSPDFHQRLADAARASLAAKPVVARRARRARVAWILAGAAAAAAVLLVPRRGGPPGAFELPEYRASISGVDEYRAPTAGVRLRAGGPIRILLRPAVRVGEPVEAWFFLARADRIEPIALAVETDPSGAVRATGTVGEWGAQAKVLAAIGPKGRAPTLDDVRARAAEWRWLEQEVHVER
jgi:hypothetical protein